MSLNEVLPYARSLSDPEKLQLIRILARELQTTPAECGLRADEIYPVWSPHSAFEAASILTQLLESERASR